MDTQQAEKLAKELIAEHLHGLPVAGSMAWRFQWDRSVCRHGYCSYSRKVISLSKPLTEINSIEHVRHTILHEIAHALAYHKYGRNCGHDPLWQRECRLLGIPATTRHPGVLVSDGTLVSSTADSVGELDSGISKVAVARVAPTLRGICPICSAGFGRHRMPSTHRYCSYCWKRNGNRPDASYILTWYKVDAEGTVLAKVGTKAASNYQQKNPW